MAKNNMGIKYKRPKRERNKTNHSMNEADGFKNFFIVLAFAGDSTINNFDKKIPHLQFNFNFSYNVYQAHYLSIFSLQVL